VQLISTSRQETKRKIFASKMSISAVSVCQDEQIFAFWVMVYFGQFLDDRSSLGGVV
jgi:hypothetical protein